MLFYVYDVTVKCKPLNVGFQKLNTINLNYSSVFPILAPPLLGGITRIRQMTDKSMLYKFSISASYVSDTRK